MQQIIKELAGAYSFGGWTIAGKLSTGFVNENYKIDTASGCFFLRIHRQQALESIEIEMDLYRALSQSEFPDDFCHETLLFELAMAINGFGFIDNRWVESPLKGICIGYSRQRKLNEEESSLLPRYIQLTALALSCWHIHNGIIDSSNPRSIARAEELVGRVAELEGQLDEIGGLVHTSVM